MKLDILVKLETLEPEGIRTQIKEVLKAYGPSIHLMNTKVEKGLGDNVADLVIDLKSPGGEVRHLMVEIKNYVSPSSIREPLRQLKAAVSNKKSTYPVFATTFLSPKTRQICREEGVGYFDLAGNVYLRFEDLLLDRSVEKNPFPRMGRPSSIFTPVSSRILRALLEEPKRKWKLDELAKGTEVSLGQAFKVCRQLIQEGYVSRPSKRGPLILEQPGQLLDVWRDQYAFTAHQTRSYYSFERDLGRLMNAITKSGQENKYRYAITSFAAASMIAPFVRGNTRLTCYVEREALEDWQKTLELRPVEEGATLILVIPNDSGVFYRTQQIKEMTIVGNIQLYLDLYSDPARGQEQADQLRKERIKF